MHIGKYRSADHLDVTDASPNQIQFLSVWMESENGTPAQGVVVGTSVTAGNRAATVSFELFALSGRRRSLLDNTKIIS
jgi:hypothetical protein